jgi:hypothetical protein
MTATLFFVFLGVLLLGCVIGIAGMARLMGSGGRTTLASIMGTQLVAVLVMVIGTLGAVVTGVIWMVNKFSG